MLKYYSKLQVIHFQLWPTGGVVRLRKEGNHNQEKKKRAERCHYNFRHPEMS